MKTIDSLSAAKRPAALAALALAVGAVPTSAQDPCPQQAGSSQDFEHLQGGPLECVFFKDALEGWTGEEGGRMRHTTDGGTTWHFHYMDDRTVIHDVFFLPAPNDQYGWAVGAQGSIWRTTNGGDCWDTIHGHSVGDPITKYGEPTELFMVAFEDPLIGKCVGRSGRLLETVDGGLTWTQSPSWNDLDLYAVTRTSQAWFVAGDNVLIRSEDGGLTWDETDLLPFNLLCTPPASHYPEIWDIAFVDDNLGFAGGGSGAQCGFILTTTDGGDTWVEDCIDMSPNGPPAGWNHVTTVYGLSTYDTQFGDCSLEITPRSEAATVGYGGQLFLRQVYPPYAVCGATMDSWYWHQWTPNMERPPMQDVGGVGTDIWYCGQFGVLRNTTDCGTTFQDIGTSTPRRLEGGVFVDDLNGYVVGQKKSIFETTDGGDSWTETYTGTTGGTTALGIAFSPSGATGIAVGQGSFAVKNTGSGWSTASAPNGLTITDVDFQNENTAYAVGHNVQYGSKLLRATSPNWNLVETKMFAGQLHSVAVTSGGTAYVVGYDGAAYEVTNNGQTATAINVTGTSNPANTDLMAVITNGTDTWAVGAANFNPVAAQGTGCVVKLNGTTGDFEAQSTGITSPIAYLAVEFNGSNVVLGGYGGTLVNFDGSTWSELESSTNGIIKDISYPSTGHGYVIGKQFLITESN